MRTRRLRGWVLRLVLDRRRAIVVGVLVAMPGVILLAGHFTWESSITDGVGMLTVATGAAIAWAGLSGRRADWIE
jgi:hypothetical protein